MHERWPATIQPCSKNACWEIGKSTLSHPDPTSRLDRSSTNIHLPADCAPGSSAGFLLSYTSLAPGWQENTESLSCVRDPISGPENTDDAVRDRAGRP